MLGTNRAISRREFRLHVKVHTVHINEVCRTFVVRVAHVGSHMQGVPDEGGD